MRSKVEHPALGRFAAAKRLAALAFACTLALGAVTACGSDDSGSAAEDNTLTIGYLNANVGPYAAYSKPAYEGVKMSVDRLNKEGVEIAGKKYKIVLDSVETKGDNTLAVTEARGLIRDKGIKFLMSPPSVAWPGVPALAAQSKVLLLSHPGSAEQNFPTPDKRPAAVEASKGVDKLTFGYAPAFWDAGYGAGNHVTQFPDWESSIKRVYILLQNDEGGKGYGAALEAALKERGITTESSYYDIDTKDFSGFLSRVKSFKPDALYSGYLQDPSLAVLRQALQSDATPRYIAWGQNIEDIRKNAIGKPIPIDSVTDVYPRSLIYTDDPKLKELGREYEARVGEGSLETTLASSAATTIDVIPMLIEAMKEAGTTTDLEKIAAALTQIEYDGVLGERTVDDTNHFSFSTDACYIKANDDKPSCTPVPLSSDPAKQLK